MVISGDLVCQSDPAGEEVIHEGEPLGIEQEGNLWRVQIEREIDIQVKRISKVIILQKSVELFLGDE